LYKAINLNVLNCFSGDWKRLTPDVIFKVTSYYHLQIDKNKNVIVFSHCDLLFCY